MQNEERSILISMLLVITTAICIFVASNSSDNKAYINKDSLNYFSEEEPQSFTESINQSEKIKLNQYSYTKIKTKVEKIKILELKNEIKKLNEEAKNQKEKLNKSNEEIKRLEKINTELKSSSFEDNHKEDSSNSKSKGRVINMSSSYYSAYCPTCGEWGGITATGDDISNSIYVRGKRVVAVDPNIIPLGSTVKITGGGHDFEALALDTGGAIKGNRIDILVESTEEAYRLGRRDVFVEIIN